MTDEKRSEKLSDAELGDNALNEIAGGIYSRPMGCGCNAGTVVVDGQIRCARCGSFVGQLVP